MTSITVRIDERLLGKARRHRINVSDAARQGIEDAIRAKDFRANSKWLASHQVKPHEPSGATLRRLRDDE